MLNEMNVAGILWIYSFRPRLVCHLCNAYIVPGARGQLSPAVRVQYSADHLISQVGPRIAGDCDVIGLRPVEARTCGRTRESGPVFDAGQPLFFESSYQLSVAKHSRRSVAVESVQT